MKFAWMMSPLFLIFISSAFGSEPPNIPPVTPSPPTQVEEGQFQIWTYYRTPGWSCDGSAKSENTQTGIRISGNWNGNQEPWIVLRPDSLETPSVRNRSLDPNPSSFLKMESDVLHEQVLISVPKSMMDMYGNWIWVMTENDSLIVTYKYSPEKGGRKR